jgi:aminopeptidase N
MKYNSIYILLVVLFTSQCKVTKNTPPANHTESIILNGILISANKSDKPAPYQASEMRLVDLLHTTLWLSFNYENQTVMGKAQLSLKPYFYPISEVTLDAKEFTIHKLYLLRNDSVKLKYTYNNEKIVITLDREYQSHENVELFIEYTAHPSQIKTTGSSAISEAKGLYFINPTRADKNKPRQIWSQGETQSNSGWFPTIDAPNERMTQEIYLTVDATDITLSNGLLIYSTDEPNGKRTDYWSQKLPAAPYLTMIAVGEFVKTADTWRDSVEVNYYLEEKYAPYANLIFGATPQMLECFSTRLGVDYPWEKFSQIVVRDFVSGAMENTSAVIHFEPVQHTPREHLDNPWEDIIAHELFHHWFGDLVTCESWSNIPLNESFATYGEYIWNEYKYGKTFADYVFDKNLQAYLGQRNAAAKTPIRFHYETREDMFDVVSYQKGGRILHLLRNTVGDKAFFASLKLYLTRNQFNTVEIHQLRLAFEEVTGQDLNWFFNQWFLNSGHPILDIQYTYNAEHTAVTIQTKQIQDTLAHGIFRLPVAIDVYANGIATRKLVTIDQSNQSFTFNLPNKIDFVNFDAEKVLLAKVNIQQSQQEWITQLNQAPLVIDKKFAAYSLMQSKTKSITPELIAAINQLLTDTFFGNRLLGLHMIQSFPAEKQKQFEQPLARMAKNDPKPSVKAEAIDLLSDIEPNNYEALFSENLNDSAYSVVAASLEALAEISNTKALAAAVDFLTEPSVFLQSTISELLADYAKSDYVSYFETWIPKAGRYQRIFFENYATYIVRQDTLIQQKAMASLSTWYADTTNSYQERIEMLSENAQKFYITQYDDATQELKNKKLTPEAKAILQRKQAVAYSMYTQWGVVAPVKKEQH